MNTDDELRAQLVREQARRSHAVRATEVLTELRPAMRTARRRRVATTAAAAALSLGGLVAAAQVVRTDPDSSIRTSSSTQQPEAPIAPPGNATPSTPTETIGIESDGPPAGIDGSDQSPGGDDTTTSVADRTDEAIATPGQGAATPPPDDVVDPPSPPGATSTVPPPTSTTTAATTTPTTTPGPAGPERFDSACGYAWAIRTADAVVLTEVVAYAGYQYRLEDPDLGAITIQFTGIGEDCELTIPTTVS